MRDEQKANLRWWVAMVVMCALIVALNYKHLSHILVEAAKAALTISAWGLWTKAFADIYHRFFDRRPFTEWSNIVFAAAAVCSLLMWAIHDDFREVAGVLYFAAISAAVILIVFRSSGTRQ